MGVKTGKAVSRYLGAFVFLLLLIKDFFPSAALAFTSANSCFKDAACRILLQEAFSSSVKAPLDTGAGNAQPISVTDSSGATKAAVDSVGNTAMVVGPSPTYATFHYWDQATNGRAQKIAKDNYCILYPNDPVCGVRQVTFYSPNNRQWLTYRIPQNIISYTISDCYWDFGNGQGPIYCGKSFLATQPDGTPPAHSCAGPEIDRSTLKDERTGDVPWKDWPQAKRDAAVALLTDSDWQRLANSMPEGGRLDPGDTINADNGTIVIPGQDLDNPDTLGDDRPLKTVPGRHTIIPYPDNDHDTNPDSSDPDDDDDGIPDTYDPEPLNPSAPIAQVAMKTRLLTNRQ